MDRPDEDIRRKQADIALSSAHPYAYFQLLGLMHPLYEDVSNSAPLSPEARRRL